MDRQRLFEIAEDAVREEELRSSDIPAIDLYVDQIINLVAEKQKEGSARYRERQLTKTMINNYSKDGLITPVKGKKYNKEQIVQMLTVYTLKNTLSIGEIKRLLDGAYACEGFGGEDLIRLYDEYLSIKRDNRAYAVEIMDALLKKHSLEVSDDRDFMLTVGSLLSLSAFLRQTAQAMIDEAYPVPEEEPEEKKDKEKEKEKDKDKEKEKQKKEKDKQKEKEKKKKTDANEELDLPVEPLIMEE
ncbi:MAG: DUF1836 domain-containing protein [Clostridia bacterium]|nr:DUF1836 domain-containing protein [Clostridia bacterium]